MDAIEEAKLRADLARAENINTRLTAENKTLSKKVAELTERNELLMKVRARKVTPKDRQLPELDETDVENPRE